MDVVDAGDGGPELVLTEPWGGPCGLAARVGAGPFIGGDKGRRVRGIFERVIRAVELAGFHCRKFAVIPKAECFWTPAAAALTDTLV